MRVALRAVESARQAAERQGAAARAAHVGYHLIGSGPAASSRPTSPISPTLGQRLRRARASRTRPRVYLGAIALADRAAASAPAVAYARDAGGVAAARWSRRAARCSSRPASSRSRSCSGWSALARSAAPAAAARSRRRRPGRRAHDGGRADAARRASTGVAALLEHLEVLALGNLDPHIHFAILSDFADAASARAARATTAILAAARAGIEALNARFGDGRRRPLLPLPPRAPVERARAACGWAGSASAASSKSSTGCCAARPTRASRVAGRRARACCRACATASRSTPTRACRATRRSSSIGIIAHPLNRPALRSARCGRVTEGYGILQPRVSVTMASAAGSLFARALRRPHRRRSLHHRGLGHLPGPVRRGHLHRQGPLRRRRVHGGARGARARERAALARPVRGPLRAHRARHRRRGRRRLPVERARARAPAAPLGARRLADPVRGCSRACRRARGLERNRLPLISRWKILDNLRRSLVAPATRGAAAARGWTVLPGRPRRLDARPRWPRSPFPLLSRCCSTLAGRRRAAAWPRVFLRAVAEDLRDRLARVALQLDVPRQPGLRDARTRSRVTLVRLVITAAPPARVGDRGRRRRARRAARRARGVRTRRWRRARSIALGVALAGRRSRSPQALPVGAADPRCCGRSAPLDRASCSAGRCRRRGRELDADDRAFLDGGRARDLALLRDVRRRRGSRAAARQRPGDARAAHRAPHLADQHRHGPARDARGARPRLHRHRRAGRAARRDADDGRGPRALRGPPAQLVRHARRWRRCRRATSPPSTAATSPARC